jgi:hypothetical protein
MQTKTYINHTYRKINNRGPISAIQKANRLANRLAEETVDDDVDETLANQQLLDRQLLDPRLITGMSQ